jgi:hypothetical protein
MRPEDRSAAAQSALFGTFRDCAAEIRRFFLKILLKSGAYGGKAGQDAQRNLFFGAQMRDGDSHQLKRGSLDFREELPSHFPNRWPCALRGGQPPQCFPPFAEEIANMKTRLGQLWSFLLINCFFIFFNV